VIRRFSTSSGSSIYIEEAGAGRPVLAVHGLGGGTWFFSGMARRLAGSCRLISVDLPGTGRSQAPLDALSIERWIADLGELVERDVREPVVFVGHSLGTILALHAAVSWPHLLRGAVFAGGLPEPLAPIKERLAKRAEIVAQSGMEGTGAAVAAANFAPATLARSPEMVAMFERLFEAQDPAAYARCCRILMTASAEALVARVRTPALSISGADDQYAPPDHVSAFVRRIPGCAQELLPDCGHFPFLEQPGAFASLVSAFVARL
jgi:3-oxoadipate enol-lactonase